MTRPPARSDRSRADRRPRPPRRDAGRTAPVQPEEVNPAELPTGPPPALPPGGLRVVALGGIGEVGRNMTVFEHEGRLLVVDCGVLFPSEDSPGVDLILPGLPGDRGAARRHRRARAHPRPRRPHRRGAVPAAPAAGPHGRRVPVHARAGRREVQGAPAHPAPAGGRRGRAAAARAVGLRVLRGQPLDPGRAGRRDPHAGRAWCCTPATSSSTSSRSTGGSPTSPGSPGSATRASTCSSSTPPTPTCPGFVTAEREIGPVLDERVPPRRRRGSSSPASPATCTACSRCSTPRPTHGRRVCLVGRSMVRNMGIAAELGFLNVPDGPARRARRRDGAARTTSSCSSPRGRRASRSRRCRGWPAATTGRCGSGPRTP